MEIIFTEKHVRQAACYLAIIQGLTYASLALACIILYNQDVLNLSLDSYMDTVNAYMYLFFLGPVDGIFIGQILTPGVFTGFVWVHFIFHLFWIAVSVKMLRTSDDLKLNKTLRAWSATTFLVCFWDSITVIFLGADYSICLDWAKLFFYRPEEILANQMGCANGILPVLVIAAKGFVLWIINLIFAGIFFIMSRRVVKGRVWPLQQGPNPANWQMQHLVVPHGTIVEYLPEAAGSVPPTLYVNNQVPIPRPDFDPPTTFSRQTNLV